jgi:hypothetical protein
VEAVPTLELAANEAAAPEWHWAAHRARLLAWTFKLGHVRSITQAGIALAVGRTKRRSMNTTGLTGAMNWESSAGSYRPTKR